MNQPNAQPRTRLRNRPEAARKRGAPPGGVQDPQRGSGDAQTLVAAQLMTAEELAKRWQVPKARVYRLTREGAVPVVRLGKYVRYRIDAIEGWEEEQSNA